MQHIHLNKKSNLEKIINQNLRNRRNENGHWLRRIWNKNRITEKQAEWAAAKPPERSKKWRFTKFRFQTGKAGVMSLKAPAETQRSICAIISADRMAHVARCGRSKARSFANADTPRSLAIITPKQNKGGLHIGEIKRGDKASASALWGIRRGEGKDKRLPPEMPRRTWQRHYRQAGELRARVKKHVYQTADPRGHQKAGLTPRLFLCKKSWKKFQKPV